MRYNAGDFVLTCDEHKYFDMEKINTFQLTPARLGNITHNDNLIFIDDKNTYILRFFEKKKLKDRCILTINAETSTLESIEEIVILLYGIISSKNLNFESSKHYYSHNENDIWFRRTKA